MSALVVFAAVSGFALAQANQDRESARIDHRQQPWHAETVLDGTLSPHDRATPTPRTIPNDKSVIQRESKPQK